MTFFYERILRTFTTDSLDIKKMFSEYEKCIHVIDTMTLKTVDSTYKYICLWRAKWLGKNILKEGALGFHKWDEYIDISNRINECFETLRQKLNDKNLELIKIKYK